MCLYTIATEYNGPLEAAHAHSDDDRYDIAGCGAIGQLQLEFLIYTYTTSQFT